MANTSWNQKGATLSHKNACKEFNLGEASLIQAINDGVLQYRVNYAHGNPYFRLLRAEVQRFAESTHGKNVATKIEMKNQIGAINTEIRKLQRKIKALEEQRRDLEKKQQ